MGIFIILVSTGAGFTLPSLRMNRLGGNVTDATFYAAEGLEAAKSIRYQGWTTPFLATSCSGGCGVSASSGFWAWNGVNNTKPPYTRAITVSSVGRDGSGNIVASGGTDDPNTKKVTSAVNWNFIAARPETISLVTYVTNWVKSIIGNWGSVTQETCLDLTGAQDGRGVATSGNYAYVVRNNTTNNFTVIDITTPATPSISTTISLTGTPSNIAISGNYAFVTTDANAGELVVVNITNPLVPTVAATLNITGNNNANSLYISGNFAYVVRASGASNFNVVNITTPTAPVVSGSLTLAGAGTDVFVMGNFAYVSSDDNAQELQVVNVTTPATPTAAGSLNLTGNSNALSITGFGTTVMVGRVDGTVAIVNVTTPATPTLLATYTAGTLSVARMTMIPTNSYLLLATFSGTQEFQSVLVTTLTSPTLGSAVNMADNLTGVAYSQAKDRAIVTGINNTTEVCVMKPN